MMSPNLLKSHQSPIGGGGFQIELPTFDAESKFAKSPKSHFQGVFNFQLLMSSPNLLKPKKKLQEVLLKIF